MRFESFDGVSTEFVLLALLVELSHSEVSFTNIPSIQTTGQMALARLLKSGFPEILARGLVASGFGQEVQPNAP